MAGDQANVEVVDQSTPEVGGDAFHSFTGDDGHVTSWKTPDELNSWIKKSGMFQSDYTRKTQELGKSRSQFEKEREEFKKLKEDWEKNEKAKYDRYNEALSRRPQIAQQLQRLVDQPSSPDEIFTRAQGYTDNRYSNLEQELQSIKSQLEEERLEKERDRYFSELENEIPNFDRNQVMDILQTMDGGDMKSLMATIWKASQYDPVKMQQQVEQNLAHKKGAGMVPSGGGPPPSKKGPQGMKKAHEEALREYASR